MSHQSDLIASDINEYLAQHERKDMLRFLTCGSVDDGKSTLIGRLLYDSKMIYEDQLEAIESDSVKHGTTGEKIDLALLVDGLQAEREQGITIDVAYRYFSTTSRKFIIADTPGHEQYTRNMATGASTCDVAVILIDARHGVVTQTRRHSYIASLLGIKHVIVAINKMDLVDFDEAVFNQIKDDYTEFTSNLNECEYLFVPLSALDGDNVVNRSERSPWFKGLTLMEMLENVEVSGDKNFDDFRFPVQYVNRPNLDFRGFCGTVASGAINKGDEIQVLPSGKTSKIKDIVIHEGSQDVAFVGQAVTLTLEDEIDVSRGDMILKVADQIESTNHLKAHLVWMDEASLQTGRQYFFKFSSKVTSGAVENIAYRIDVNTQERTEVDSMGLNDIAVVDVVLEQVVVVDKYPQNRATGAFIIIDRLTNLTVAAGMVKEKLSQSEFSTQAPAADAEVSNGSAFEIELNALVRKHFPHWGAKDISKILGGK